MISCRINYQLPTTRVCNGQRDTRKLPAHFQKEVQHVQPAQRVLTAPILLETFGGTLLEMCVFLKSVQALPQHKYCLADMYLKKQGVSASSCVQNGL